MTFIKLCSIVYEPASHQVLNCIKWKDKPKVGSPPKQKKYFTQPSPSTTDIVRDRHHPTGTQPRSTVVVPSSICSSRISIYL